MAKPLIVPTVGRVVWYFPGESERKDGWSMSDEGVPLAAIIAGVINDKFVNLSVLDAQGVQRSRQTVFLTSGWAEENPNGFGYAAWMPYQIEQAKNQLKSDAACAVRKTPSDPHIRKQCIELAVASAKPVSNYADILEAAVAFEKHILNKENKNG